MNAEAPRGCTAPPVGAMAAGYCFDDLSGRQRDEFVAHLVVCDACWEEVKTIEAAVSALRADERRCRAIVLQDLNVLLGPSSRLHERFAGHGRFALATGAITGLLCGLAFLAEVAFAFDRFGLGALAFSLAGTVLLASAAAGSLWLIAAVERRGRSTGATAGAATLAAGLAVYAIGGSLLLPPEPLIHATFQTYPANLGFLKTMFWTALPTLVLVTLPFGAVLTLQRELAAGRHKGVLLLLTRHPLATAPRGLPIVPPILVGIAGGVLVGLDFVGMSHLFDALKPGPYLHLFMTIRFGRFALLALLLIVSLWWYSRALADLKREAIAGAPEMAGTMH